MSRKQLIESIVRLLELAGREKLLAIYHFVLHFV